MKIKKIVQISKSKSDVYDINIKRNHNFIYDGTVLHNCDYQGLISCLIINNHYENPYTINPGERIAQAKFIPKIRPKCTAKIVREFSTFTERDSNGFGTTGKF